MSDEPQAWSVEQSWCGWMIKKPDGTPFAWERGAPPVAFDDRKQAEWLMANLQAEP